MALFSGSKELHLNWDCVWIGGFNLLLYLFLGQERFGNMTRVYYKEAVGAFVVFDISRGSTFEAVLKWKSDLDSKVHLPNGGPIPAVLLANKCDQKKEGGHNPSQMEQFCKEHGFTGWFETSAKVRSASRLYPLCCYLVNLSCNCKVFRWIYASGCWKPRKKPKAQHGHVISSFSRRKECFQNWLMGRRIEGQSLH